MNFCMILYLLYLGKKGLYLFFVFFSVLFTLQNVRTRSKFTEVHLKGVMFLSINCYLNKHTLQRIITAITAGAEFHSLYEQSCNSSPCGNGNFLS